MTTSLPPLRTSQTKTSLGMSGSSLLRIMATSHRAVGAVAVDIFMYPSIDDTGRPSPSRRCMAWEKVFASGWLRIR